MDVNRNQIPRFAIQKTLVFNPNVSSVAFDKSMDYKISFAYANNRFITPWIKVFDPQGNQLDVLEITFSYMGNDIIDMKYKTKYIYSPNAIDNSMYIRYEWKEVVRNNTKNGLIVLMLFSFGTMIYITYSVIVHANNDYSMVNIERVTSHRD